MPKHYGKTIFTRIFSRACRSDSINDCICRLCESNVFYNMRIDKFLSECKVATRSETAKAVRRGDVLLDGVPVKRADTPVDPDRSVVTYCGEVVRYRRYTYVLLNKPDGYVSATEDKKEKTVLDLLSLEDRRKDIFPAGNRKCRQDRVVRYRADIFGSEEPFRS